jgi:hypothetical protein
MGEAGVNEYGVFTIAENNQVVDMWDPWRPTLAAVDDPNGWLDVANNRLSFPFPGGRFHITTAVSSFAVIGYFTTLKYTLQSNMNGAQNSVTINDRPYAHIVKVEVTPANTDWWYTWFEWVRNDNSPVVDVGTLGSNDDDFLVYVRRLN